MILNSWHRSDKKASVEDRLGDTMSEAGVSKPLRMIFSRGFLDAIASVGLHMSVDRFDLMMEFLLG